MKRVAFRQSWPFFPVSFSTDQGYARRVNYFQNIAPSTAFSSSKLNLLKPHDLLEAAKADWFHENSQSATGAKLKSLPILGNILGPFRDGELTIFTGPTGTGKTTILSQLSLDYAAQNIGTLWGSFEIKNSRLVRMMLQQISDPPLQVDSAAGVWNEDSLRRLESICTAFSHLPLAFMEAHGSTLTHDVLDAMYKAAEFKDPTTGGPVFRHFILDNLQFMLANQHSSSLDKFDLSDRTVSALRTFATNTNCHVTLVIHPRKEQDDTFLGLSSISGTAKATQEADNVIILQKVESKRYLDVRKNRHSGQLGLVQIGFDPATRLIRELPNEDRDRN